MKKGKFIVIEGLDGCGKSTISKGIISKYNAITLSALPNELKPWLELIGKTNLPEATFSYFTLCNILNSQKIEKLINDGKNIILDRYFYTTYVYHKVLLKNALPVAIKDTYLKFLKPDLVIYLNVSQETRVKRISERDGELQWYGDKVSLEQDLTEDYFQLFEELKVEKIIVDNENNSIEQSLEIINNKINSLT